MRLPLHSALLLTLVVFGAIGCRSGMSGFDSAWKRPDMSGLAFWKKQESQIPSPPALHFDPTPANNDKVAKQSHSGSKTVQEQELKDSLDKLAEYEKEATASTKGALAEKADSTIAEFGKLAPKGALTNAIDSTNSIAKEKTDQGAELARSEFNAAMQNKSDSIKQDISSFKSTTNELVNNTANDLSKDFQPIKPSPNQQNKLASQPLQPNSAPKSQLDNTFPQGDIRTGTNQLASMAELEQEKLNQIGVRGPAKTNPLSADQQRLETEVAKAQREISELKAQLSNRNVQPLTSIKTDPPKQSVDTQTARNNQLAPLQNFERPSASQGFNPLISSKPADSSAMAKTDSSTFKSAAEFSKPVPAAAPSATSGQYATTNHSAFAPIQPQNPVNSATPAAAVQRVGLNAQDAVEPGDRYAAMAKDHVSEVAIPDSVLQGKGSFAPGSVNRLRGQ